MVLAAKCDHGCPTPCSGVLNRAFKRALTDCASVSVVLRSRGRPQIAPGVVRRDTVNVVEDGGRPFSRDVQPDQAMSLIRAIMKPHRQVAVLTIKAARRFASKAFVHTRQHIVTMSPRQQPGLRVVVQGASNHLGGKLIAWNSGVLRHGHMNITARTRGKASFHQLVT